MNFIPSCISNHTKYVEIDKKCITNNRWFVAKAKTMDICQQLRYLKCLLPMKVNGRVSIKIMKIGNIPRHTQILEMSILLFEYQLKLAFTNLPNQHEACIRKWWAHRATQVRTLNQSIDQNDKTIVELNMMVIRHIVDIMFSTKLITDMSCNQ